MPTSLEKQCTVDYCPVLPKNGNGPTVYSQSFDQRITFPVKTQRRRRSFIIERESIQVGQTVFCGESEKLMAYQRHRPSLG
ncbi:hypothetical protein HOLleu_09435 [Holothuria leucospilota]|uniref:Uncharacterized protein n=1 Tax=Holothuria leucospilota TaxID=206669 RepID=A0A9Q1CBH5_HOLLE|nr:hypothetical protein HOLleu_09435 [Holothuria leucospilota]